MNKDDFLTSMILNIVSAGLIVEYLCGLSLALECLIGWTIISLLVHINILKDYIVFHIEEVK